MKWFYSLLSCLFLPAMLYAAGISYTVNFEGIENSDVINNLESVSQLVALKKKRPTSINALRFRAESDLPILIKVLHSYGYYEATIHVRIEEGFDAYCVHLEIEPGPRYILESYNVHLKLHAHAKEPPKITAKMLGIELHKPVNAQNVLNAELKLLQLLSECGFPLATIDKREMIADGETKTLSILIETDAGPFSRFGMTTISGLSSVKPILIERKICWKQGEPYSSALVEKTHKILIDTGLFTSVHIAHANALDDQEQLPMKIEVAETKHKSINIGASYLTTYGAGVTFGWENRNVSGLGRKLSLQADIAQRGVSGVASYLIPDFYIPDQELLLQAQASREELRAYHSHLYFFLSRFSKQVNPYLYFSSGIKAERLVVTDSVDNNKFLLLEFPFHLKWSNANSQKLNPTKGFTFEWRITPSIDFLPFFDFYLPQTFSFSSYIPFGKNEFLVLAQKITLGSIVSPDLEAIPVPKRFLGGSEDNLRGYRYLTVSPLKGDKPRGGRSAFYYTIEPRFRVTRSVGIVPFFDLGNVYATALPEIKHKILKSVGLGLRYFSFFGPLRLDVAFPLNRRKSVDDPVWWMYVSLGQTF